MNRSERRASAKKAGLRRTTAGAETVAGLYQTAFSQMQAGRNLDAQLRCQQALALDPNHAETLHLMGVLSLHARQYDHALEWISRAIRQEPKAVYLTNLGATLVNLGRGDEALKAYDKAVQLKPLDADLWRNLGNVLIEVNRPADAILSFQHALKLNPRHWDAANKVALLLYRSERFEEALACYNLCDELEPNHCQTLYMRALTLHKLKRLDEALADNRRALALDPTNADTYRNIGHVLISFGRNEEALSWFDHSLELQPNSASTLTNKALTLAALRRFDEALSCYDRSLELEPNSALTLTDKAISLAELRRFDEAFATYHQARAIDPGYAVADWNLALLQLLTGNFEAGWAGREARWKIPVLSAHYPKLSQPMWLGKEPIEGKTILINVDEGLGDTIQFARYVPMVAELGARIILAVQDALCPLLSELPGVSQCVAFTASELPAFDMYCSISSLPLAFGTKLETIPSARLYLPAPAECLQAWEDRLGPHDRLRIGLVWSGNPRHDNDHNRSIPLRLLTPLLDVDATFVSLQKDPRPDDKATLLERTEIIDLTTHLTDFVETAALVSCLDLVISVDTSVVHLAGALGRPTWILLPYRPDWRWLLDRNDSPWYPTARLFRQTAAREYQSVVDRIRAEVLAMISARKAR
jgi:tetratricopeptide (TPR) repeat protein